MLFLAVAPGMNTLFRLAKLRRVYNVVVRWRWKMPECCHELQQRHQSEGKPRDRCERILLLLSQAYGEWLHYDLLCSWFVVYGLWTNARLLLVVLACCDWAVIYHCKVHSALSWHVAVPSRDEASAGQLWFCMIKGRWWCTGGGWRINIEGRIP